MKQLVISEETVQKALFDIIGAYKIIRKIEKSGMPDNRLRARDAATLIEMGINQFMPLISDSISGVLKMEIDNRQRGL